MQSDIFKIVREKLDILDHIRSVPTASVKKVGEDTFRVDPCLWCGHMGCLTVYVKNQTFNCFSCGEAGDIIHVEKRLGSLDSNRAAAESLIRRFNLESSQSETAGGLSNNTDRHILPTNYQKQPCESNTPPADTERLLILREQVAAFYHRQLLDNEQALQYMTKKRGHSIGILEKVQAGFAAGDVINFAKENGFSVDELIQIGLVKRTGNSLRPVISDGLIVFPQKFKGSSLFQVGKSNLSFPASR